MKTSVYKFGLFKHILNFSEVALHIHIFRVIRKEKKRIIKQDERTSLINGLHHTTLEKNNFNNQCDCFLDKCLFFIQMHMAKTIKIVMAEFELIIVDQN